MQNLLPKFKQSSIISKKQGYLFEKFNIRLNIYYWTVDRVSYLTMPTEECSRFFDFRSWVINKNGFSKCVETRTFLFLQITEDLNKIRKNPEHPFLDIVK